MKVRVRECYPNQTHILPRLSTNRYFCSCTTWSQANYVSSLCVVTTLTRWLKRSDTQNTGSLHYFHSYAAVDKINFSALSETTPALAWMYGNLQNHYFQCHMMMWPCASILRFMYHVFSLTILSFWSSLLMVWLSGTSSINSMSILSSKSDVVSNGVNNYG